MPNNTDCKNCSNTSCLIHKHVGEPSIEAYLKNKHTTQCKKGQSIIVEGTPVEGMHFVHTGKVKVFSTGINAREQILRFAINGEMVGIRGFSSRQSHAIGAVALENTTMCHFSMDTLKEMLLSNPNMAYDFMVFYAEELNRSETKVRMYAHMTVREKVIDTILYLFRKFGNKNGVIDIQVSTKEIANFAGTEEEQVIRILFSLKKEKLIDSYGKKIGIPEVDLMKKEIEDHHFFIQS
ncbi:MULTISPECIES: Crp/Fnr family transcriptional regulator [unclassified Saccharicrinis]|uniref:Crp/Fnr family transcriptional regulator n=1 Tax=unclassified Saccharicrinis TaxID=2646859 RepID=UPI003D344107